MSNKVNNVFMPKRVVIGNKKISYQDPVFIIAEAGVNHNGNLKTALALVDIAAEAGADCVKFQTFKAGDVATAQAPLARYQKQNLGQDTNQLAVIKNLELTVAEHKKIINRCRERDIIFLSTPHGGFASVDLLQKLGVPAFKVGSGDLTNLSLLEYIARLRKPIIIGTGMATMVEIKAAVSCIKRSGNNKIIVLHCTTDYPCSFKNVNLRAMRTMMKKLDTLVGYSDHTLGTQVSVMAATLGACVIEKHFTLDSKIPGLDHAASLEPAQLKELVQSVRNARVILGQPVKIPAAVEKPYIPIVRKSVVANIDIRKGEVFSDRNLAIKRPGTGLAPKYFKKILGKKAKRNLLVGTLLTKKDADL